MAFVHYVFSSFERIYDYVCQLIHNTISVGISQNELGGQSRSFTCRDENTDRNSEDAYERHKKSLGTWGTPAVVWSVYK